MSALNQQVGGDHYKKMKIQPFEFSMANGLDPIQHTIIKYVTRYEQKKGLEDLEKAKHCVDLLIQFKYPDAATKSQQLSIPLKPVELADAEEIFATIDRIVSRYTELYRESGASSYASIRKALEEYFGVGPKS